MTTLLLAPPSRLTKALGPVRDRSDCIDTVGKLVEFDRAYACYDDDGTILISYTLKESAITPQEALRAVGLQMSAPPQRQLPMRNVYVWSKARGNALPVGKVRATTVEVFANLANTTVVTVNVGPEDSDSR